MRIHSIVSIDTECDQGSQWRTLSPMKFTSVTELVPNILQKIFIKHKVKPTYLLSPEVIEDKTCASVLKSLSNVELGSHLHGEFVEPLKKPVGQSMSDFQAMYPPEIEAAKLANLTRLFEDRIGYKPTSFRAGRWGISPHTFKILEDLGYLVDSSVTPYFIWEFPGYTLNYKTALDVPYFPSLKNMLMSGDMRLLQVPVTIYSQYGSFLNRGTPYLPSFLKNALLQAPLWRPKWLRPTYSDFNQMKQVIDAYIFSHREQEDVVLNMMFHSVEILGPENPYDFDQKRIDAFLLSMERVFDYLHTLNAQFIGLSDVHPIFEQHRSNSRKNGGTS
jgi:hypothetical protein